MIWLLLLESLKYYSQIKKIISKDSVVEKGEHSMLGE